MRWSLHALTSPTDRLRSELVSKSRTGQLSARFVVIPELRIIEHIPCRLGEDPALDDAVRLICTARPADALQAYGTALRSLNGSINQGLSSEAMAAATLLHMHELSRDASCSTWAVHAEGVMNMLKVRGADGIKTEFDKCLLQAQVGNIYFGALRERQPCFLALPEWNEKVGTPLSQSAKYVATGRDWEMQLISIGVHLPGLICRFEKYAARRDAGSLAIANDGPTLLDDLKSLRRELKDVLACMIDVSKLGPTSGRGRDHSRRLQPALLFSAEIYLILIDYMLEDGGSDCFDTPGDRSRCAIPPCLDNSPNTVKLERARALYERLWNVDGMAARSTTYMMKLTVERVLSAARSTTADTGTTSLLLKNMHQLLAWRPQVHS